MALVGRRATGSAAYRGAASAVRAAPRASATMFWYPAGTFSRTPRHSPICVFIVIVAKATVRKRHLPRVGRGWWDPLSHLDQADLYASLRASGRCLARVGVSSC